MKKKELTAYTEVIIDIVLDYSEGNTSKEMMKLRLLNSMNKHLSKSWWRRLWEA